EYRDYYIGLLHNYLGFISRLENNDFIYYLYIFLSAKELERKCLDPDWDMGNYVVKVLKPLVIEKLKYSMRDGSIPYPPDFIGSHKSLLIDNCEKVCGLSFHFSQHMTAGRRVWELCNIRQAPDDGFSLFEAFHCFPEYDSEKKMVTFSPEGLIHIKEDMEDEIKDTLLKKAMIFDPFLYREEMYQD